MRTFLLTEQQAGKLPRWALLLLCALYALPGFVGRDPWRVDDAAGFGVALTMARGGLDQWLMPGVFGEPVVTGGPLPFWLSALLARLFHLAPEHATVRAAAVLGLALMWILLWYATYELARRPGVQPSDPFEAAASRTDFGRAIADSALLLMLATLGLLVRLHETTAAAAQVTFVCLFMFGAATAPAFPRRGGILTGLGVAAIGLTSGWPSALALTLAMLAMPVISAPHRLVAPSFLAGAIPVALVCTLAWPAALMLRSDQSALYLQAWLTQGLSSVSGPAAENFDYLWRTAPWFFWPAWPMAIWSLIGWRSRLAEPVVAVPLLTLVPLMLVTLLAPHGDETPLLPLAAPMIMLAAVGLPLLSRTIVSLIDWFAVMTFTLFGVAVWAYWIAYVSGYPPTMAFKAAQLAPGFKPQWIVVEIALGAAATLAWLALVRWRISRHPPMIWRAVVLASGGLVLAWFLLMTLWLQVFNERNTYRDLAIKTGQQIPDNYRCVEARGLGLTERTSIAYFASLTFGSASDHCDWLLIEDSGPVARLIRPQETGWRLVWQGSRPSAADERFRLYRRAG